MKSYFLIISGLRHHDFKGRLDELYRLAPGRRMSISIEHNNPGEQDAVIVYCGKDFVGYVRSGSDKNLAVSLIKSSGRDSLLGRIKGVDRENNWLMMEITSEAEELPEIESLPCIFDNWEYDGEGNRPYKRSTIMPELLHLMSKTSICILNIMKMKILLICYLNFEYKEI